MKARVVLGVLLVAAAVAAIPSSAAAASCPVAPGVFTTTWIGGSGHYNTDANWSNGGPSGSCDASIVAPGNYTVTMNAGSVTKSMTIGGAGSTPTLQISAENANTNLLVTTSALSIASGAGITLLCNVPPENCGAPNLSAPTISNAGTIAVDASVDGMPFISGPLTNTGTMQFNHAAKFNNGAVTNQGTFNIADGVTAFSGGSSCGDTSVSFKNDTGGTLDATGTGTFDVINYEQGAGPTSGTLPVQLPCGSLKYTGNGASTVQANGGFALTGEMQVGQSLIVSAASSNTNAVLGGNFVNKGSITLTCPGGGCSGGPGGGAGFNANGNLFTNEGTFTFAAAGGTGAGTSGGMTNKGTIQFDQSGFLSGVVTNQGVIGIATEKVAISSTSSCGDTGPRVINDTGGQVKSVGSGTLSAVNFEQGAGTTSGSEPVSMNCGSLNYTGSGASTITVPNSASMTGNLAAGQTVRVIGTLHTAGFTNAGTVILDQSASNPNINTGGTVVNTGAITTSGSSANSASIGGTLEQTGASAQTTIAAGTKLGLSGQMLLKAGRLGGTGTLTGSVYNSGGTVAPGSSPGTLTLTGSYTQGAGGSLEIEVAGTGAGQFDKLAVGGNATLGGTLALKPSSAYAASAAPGNSVAFLTYGGTRGNAFAQTTANPALACPNQFSASYDDGAKTVLAAVSANGPACPVAAPEAKLGKHPKAQIKTTKRKVKVSFAFSADVAGSTFQCKLDKGAYANCKSPKSYKVKPGKHKFQVRAVGAGGTGKPVSFSFRVIKQKPKG